MQNIKKVLKEIDSNLNKLQPNTMDELIDIVHRTEGAGAYGTHFTIVKYKGYLQGVRVYVTGRSKSHLLPCKGKVYSVFNGLDKYIQGGFEIEND
jgi:hypothetical protein